MAVLGGPARPPRTMVLCQGAEDRERVSSASGRARSSSSRTRRCPSDVGPDRLECRAFEGPHPVTVQSGIERSAPDRHRPRPRAVRPPVPRPEHLRSAGRAATRTVGSRRSTAMAAVGRWAAGRPEDCAPAATRRPRLSTGPDRPDRPGRPAPQLPFDRVAYSWADHPHPRRGLGERRGTTNSSVAGAAVDGMQAVRPEGQVSGELGLALERAAVPEGHRCRGTAGVLLAGPGEPHRRIRRWRVPAHPLPLHGAERVDGVILDGMPVAVGGPPPLGHPPLVVS